MANVLSPGDTPNSKRSFVSRLIAMRPVALNEKVTAWASLLTALFTLAAVIVATYQLVELNRSAKIERANQAVQVFLTSDGIRELSRRISAKTLDGTEYSAAFTNAELKQDIVFYLNPLEMIAGGVNSGRYDEPTVRSHLALTVYKVVRIHLKGKGDRIGDAFWRDNPDLKPLFPDSNAFPELRRLYRKWFQNDRYS
jgi:hypothetical protein